MQLTILSSTIMTLFLTSSLTARSVRAFAPAILRQRSSPGILVRHMAADSTEKPPMPHPDDKMPYYALGVNLAMQVGGQGNIKTLLEEDEMELVLEGFCDNLRGTSTADARVILQTYGMELNKILQDRSSRITERVKKEGEEFIASFLDCNDEAEQKERYEYSSVQPIHCRLIIWLPLHPSFSSLDVFSFTSPAALFTAL